MCYKIRSLSSHLSALVVSSDLQWLLTADCCLHPLFRPSAGKFWVASWAGRTKWPTTGPAYSLSSFGWDTLDSLPTLRRTLSSTLTFLGRSQSLTAVESPLPGVKTVATQQTEARTDVTPYVATQSMRAGVNCVQRLFNPSFQGHLEKNNWAVCRA